MHWLMVRLQLFVASIVGAALASSLVEAAPDCKMSSTGCSVEDEEATATMDKNLLMRTKGEPPNQPPTKPSFGQHNESLAAQQKWDGVDKKSPDVRRRRRRDPTHNSNRRRDYRSKGTNCADIELDIVSASDLRDADQVNIGASDPWVQFAFRLCGDDFSDDEVVFRHTPSVTNNANPVWNYKTIIKSVDLDIGTSFEVFDSDIVGNDKLGYGRDDLKHQAFHPKTVYLNNGKNGKLTYKWKKICKGDLIYC